MQDIAKHILIQARGGDIRAFEGIYRATSCFVYNVALRVTNNREGAEEVTQDVFLKIHKNLKKFQFKASFKTWVYRITVNTAINMSKHRSKEKSRTIEYDDTIRINMTEKRMNKAENEEEIASLLNMLNPDQRTCVILRNLEGLSYEEIAETLNTNINTVRTRLKRAREKLLVHFQERGGLK